jgi:flagellar hook-associated protein 1 FlgK
VPSSFFGLEIARKALAMSQLNLQVIAHNIANAGTPGYSRQRAELVTPPPLAYPSFTRPGYPQQIGTGVDVDAVKRIRDEFLDEVIRSQTSTQGRNSTVSDALSQIELIFNEPGDTGISSALSAFFAAWSDLANNPEMVSSRANLREQATTLIRTITAVDTSLKRLATDQNSVLKTKVGEVNDLARQIADLNIQIAQVRGLGDNPNDLLDTRDSLVEELSNIIPASLMEDAAGSASVLIGGLRIVERDQVHKLELVSGPNGQLDLQVRIGSQLVPDLGGKGELAGLLEVRDNVIPFFQERLDNLISSVVNRVNVLHKRGFGLDGGKGRPFFQDFYTAKMSGSVFLPVSVNEDTTLDDLGVTAGDFTIQGATVTITKEDVAPGEAITLGELLLRITDSQPYVRATIATNVAGNPYIRLDLYNPPDVTTDIQVFEGSSDFLSVFGLNDVETEHLEETSFYGNAAKMIQLSLTVKENLDTIAAAGDDGSGVFPGAGNNDNAIAIAALQASTTAISNTTFDDYFTSIIGELGSQTRTASRLVNNQSVLLDQLDIQRESIRGVSIDEEATNMITYQRIYEGAARVTQVVDSMLDTLINRTGA